MRIERFGSVSYEYDEITLYNITETRDILSKLENSSKYNEDIKKYWNVGIHPSILSLRLPLQIKLEYTYKCNMQCKYCYSASSPLRKEVMPSDKFKYIINLINAEEIPEVHILGGEPFILPKYINYLLTNLLWKSITIATNGSLITEEHCKRIKESKNSVVISIGIDGHVSDVHNATRGYFEKICSALDLLNKYDIPIQATTCINRYNFDKIEDILIFLIENNVFSVQLIPVETAHLPEHIANELRIDDKYSDLQKELFPLLNRYSNKIHIDILLNISMPRVYQENRIKYGPCPAGITTATINPDAKLITCSACSRGPEIQITKSIEEAFELLKCELQKYGRKIIERDNLVYAEKCCDIFGYGQTYFRKTCM